MCVMDFISAEEMNDQMDLFHGGRWKHDDPDIIMLGDDFEESESSDTDEEESDAGESETESGEASE